MDKKSTEKVVEQIVNDYLVDHSDLRLLFDEDSKSYQNTLFFINNIETIINIMGRLFQESELTKYYFNVSYSQVYSWTRSYKG